MIQFQAMYPWYSYTQSLSVSIIQPLQKFLTFHCATKIQGTMRRVCQDICQYGLDSIL